MLNVKMGILCNVVTLLTRGKAALTSALDTAPLPRKTRSYGTFHINRSGTNLGTFSEDEVARRIAQRKIRRHGSWLARRMPTWQPLAQISEFAQETGPSGAPTPQPQFTGGGAITPRRQSRRGPAFPGMIGSNAEFCAAFFDTLIMVLTKPAEAFTAMKREGGLGEPLIYAVIGGSVGGVIYFFTTFC